LLIFPFDEIAIWCYNLGMSLETLKLLETVREMIRLTNERIASVERVLDALVETNLAQSDALSELQKESNARAELETLKANRWSV
jgi:hypothetical protein